MRSSCCTFSMRNVYDITIAIQVGTPHISQYINLYLYHSLVCINQYPSPTKSHQTTNKNKKFLIPNLHNCMINQHYCQMWSVWWWLTSLNTFNQHTLLPYFHLNPKSSVLFYPLISSQLKLVHFAPLLSTESSRFILKHTSNVWTY